MQRRGGRFRKVVAYDSWSARAKFLSPPRMEYCAIFILKNVFFPPTILLVFITKSLAIICDSSFKEMQLVR